MRIGHTEIHLDTYSGTDTYSDGPVEDDLLRIVQNNTDYGQILKEDPRWPILYHLHRSRENVLAWYNFSGKENVLEIGSGCGALTGLLAKRCRSVTCCDISLKRCEINAYKNIACRNIDIYAGNYAHMSFRRSFDIVTLIGVLEYAQSYYPAVGADPFSELLASAKSALTSSGMLIVAIENKFGLKYWAGAREDHTSYLHDGLEGYPSSDIVRTFSRNELAALLEKAGFTRQRFYYPYPDYKFAEIIYSDAHLPRPGELGNPVHNYDLDRVQCFDEAAVWREICKADMFPFFSNSFLVFAFRS